MTLKDMVKIKVKVIILLLAWNHTTLLWTFSPKCILTEDIKGVRYFSMTLYIHLLLLIHLCLLLLLPPLLPSLLFAYKRIPPLYTERGAALY